MQRNRMHSICNADWTFHAAMSILLYIYLWLKMVFSFAWVYSNKKDAEKLNEFFRLYIFKNFNFSISSFWFTRPKMSKNAKKFDTFS